MPYYRIITFGCKVNQYDSAGLAQELVARGWRRAPDGSAPDLMLVNTCTVTARADQEARQTIRRVHREFSRTPIWATGCYAQRAPEEMAALPGVAGVLGNREKLDWAVFLGQSAAGGQPLVRVGKFSPGEAFAALHPRRFPGHTRASLKIQDGCSQACAYCIVPQVRGPSRSQAPAEVEKGLLELAAAGFQEVVLTGIDLGQYGRDLRPPLTLAALLRRLTAGPWPFRLRLSSLEPQEISPELVKSLEEFSGLCPHFHLPLQSGADPVLAAMGRPYLSEDFREVVLELCRRFPDAALGLDVLVGFPTETSRDFEATYALVASLPATYLHVFPFSPRPGTPAASLPPLPAKEVKARAGSLRELGRLKQREFYARQVGKIVEVLVEGPAGPSGWLKGLSENYLRVTLPGPIAWQNRRLPVRLKELRAGVLVGEALSR
ncbi:MAG: tRNA (N(6)-L-threonylcarbamoyladenosine(37)-C(2))-methylthiotransferase MtaB [Deltaproteobacteria bacterium]|nr:tRNA (N(6)-L-threonylcarbamoyladenosine(37)-C(2))-methylthiotransferase MtaB [Deltaproteobacteria bacterium]